jgi:hypothetical protein
MPAGFEIWLHEMLQKDGFDWVQLNNKEWLMGEIKSMCNDSLEFDSNNLDMQDIDREDVTYLRSAGASSINIEDLGEVTGVVEISGDTIKLIDGDDVKEFNRAPANQQPDKLNKKAAPFSLRFPCKRHIHFLCLNSQI